ncbi:MAG: HAMP domain-containing protein [Anaerolineae bacterium]|nr:HAMP domain-containing protein [Anaerolineae bacterium]
MGTHLNGDTDLDFASRSVPTTGMRGGLGRTLLTAFLILAIVPLSLIVLYAVQQNRQNIEQEVELRLQAVATLKGEELTQWFSNFESLFRLSTHMTGGDIDPELWWQTLNAEIPALRGAKRITPSGAVVWEVGRCDIPGSVDVPVSFYDLSEPYAVTAEPQAMLLVVIAGQTEKTLFCLDWEVIDSIVAAGINPGISEQVYLVQGEMIWPDGMAARSPAIDALYKGENGAGTYINHSGMPVVGAYSSLPEIGIGVLVEQGQAELQESSDTLATASIALTLGVALSTAVIAAVVVRQITGPVIRLTESALAMAAGDLDQHLQVTSRDEIGILTYVFNQMAAELGSLYQSLEAKVARRTMMLQRANYQIQQRAMQLTASQEVGNAIISIRDPKLLISRVADLIRDRFLYASVAIYLVEPGSGGAELGAVSPAGTSWPQTAHPGDGSVIERAVRKREIQLVSQKTEGIAEWQRRTLTRFAIPLQITGFEGEGHNNSRILGVLAVLSADREEDVPSDDLVVLGLLANQVTVALENAQAYERERLAAKQLQEAEAFKSRFLANMSHELREPLNTIIGFSRLILKGLDGPLNEAMTQDLERIYNDSQYLLSLINDILASSQIQAGLMELQIRPINLQELIDSLMPTASALVRGKEIELVREFADNMPLVRADPVRIRRVLVHLLTNAAKFTNEGSITIRDWFDEEQVYVSVSDTGIGIPPEDLGRIFTKFEKPVVTDGQRLQGAGLGLALSKEFIELHGGQIWVESEFGKGTTFTFSLPYYAVSLSSSFN